MAAPLPAPLAAIRSSDLPANSTAHTSPAPRPIPLTPTSNSTSSPLLQARSCSSRLCRVASRSAGEEALFSPYQVVQHKSLRELGEISLCELQTAATTVECTVAHG